MFTPRVQIPADVRNVQPNMMFKTVDLPQLCLPNTDLTMKVAFRPRCLSKSLSNSRSTAKIQSRFTAPASPSMNSTAPPSTKC
eukprot:2477441-Amphidinium_carterae.1